MDAWDAHTSMGRDKQSMQQTHHNTFTGDGDGPDASSLLAIMRRRARQAAKRAAWGRCAEDVISELRAEVASQREEVAYWRSKAADILGLDPDSPPPPPQYVEALCTPQQEPERLVDVEVDGEHWTVSLSPHRPIPDPLGVLIAWHQYVSGVRGAIAGES